MPIKSWPPAERPREKLLSKGPQALSDAELLAIFLRTGVKGKTALDLARELLTSYGGLRALLEAERESVCRFPGLGDAKYAELQATLELCRRYLGAKLSRSGVLSNPNETRTFLVASLRGYPYEVFACLFLDNRHRVISFEELFKGTIDGATVHPREVVKRALANNAAAVIFAHNRYSRRNRLIRRWMARERSTRYPQIYPHFADLACVGFRRAAPPLDRWSGHNALTT